MSRSPTALILALTSLCLSVEGMVAPTAAEAQSPLTTTAEINVLSDYFFAGIPFAAAEVSQARVSVATPGGFTFNAFTVYDYDVGDITEFDLYGDYYAQIAPTLGLFVGAALYNFDLATGWEGTPEVYGGLVLTAPLSPTLYVAHDFDLGDGTHAALMLSHTVPLGASGASLDLAGSVDYNDGYYVDFSGFSYADLGAGVAVPVGPLTVTPSLTLLVALEDGFQLQTGIDDTETVLGLSASATFWGERDARPGMASLLPVEADGS